MSISEIVKDIELPRMIKVCQKFCDYKIQNIPEAIQKELRQDKVKKSIVPGMRIAVTAGSRGIANYAVILREIVQFLKQEGARPFLIPAMGSHGGATAAGQTEILASYGITEDFCQCPIIASMETVQIGATDKGQKVFIDKSASRADGIVIVNRIKPHTCFTGKYESGLMKMITIGLGKQKGASVCHQTGFKYMAEMIPQFAYVILKNCNILFGVGIIENSYDETSEIIALDKEEIPEKEPGLLEKARTLMPKILLPKSDVLIVDRIGKNYSGDGMDPNITGTFATPYASGGHCSERVVILDLSDETHGNGHGLGMADFTTRRAYGKFIMEKAYPNAITSHVLEGSKIPLVMDSDREAIRAAVYTCDGIDYERAKIVRIPNSANIRHIDVSEAMLEQVQNTPGMEVMSGPEPFSFDMNGNLW